MDTLKLLEELVGIDSCTGNADGVNRANNLVREQLEALGFSCEETPAKSDKDDYLGNNLLAQTGGDAPGTLMLCHIDTVLGPDVAPFRFDNESGMVYGAGVADMKGGIVVMLRALELLKEQSGSLPPVTVALNASEETPVPSFASWIRPVAEKNLRALNFEPGILQDDGSVTFAKARKGINRYFLTCRGYSTHAGNFHYSGANAIREIARKVEFIESLTDYERDITTNAGRISGGKTYNQIADFAEIEFEVRSFKPEYHAEIDKLLREYCTETSVVSHDGKNKCVLELRKHAGFPGFEQTPASKLLNDKYTSLAANAGHTANEALRGGASDSNFVADLLPVLDGIGLPGRKFHNPGEEADFKLMDKAAQIAADFIAEL